MPSPSSLGNILKPIFSLGNIEYPDEKKAGLSHLQVYFSRIKMFWECEIRIKYVFLFVSFGILVLDCYEPLLRLFRVLSSVLIIRATGRILWSRCISQADLHPMSRYMLMVYRKNIIQNIMITTESVARSMMDIIFSCVPNSTHA